MTPLVGMALAALLQAAPSSPPPPLRLESAVEIVSITAVVRHKGGAFMTGLGKGDVEVFEDGVPQPLTYFSETAGNKERVPLSVVLVLDASGSMAKNMRFLQEAANTFVNRLEEIDQAQVVDFNSSVRSSSEFTKDVSRLEDFIDALQPWGGTSLNDAIHVALGKVKDQPGRKALLVFSDGADTTSSIPEAEVLDYARSVEATVYSVGIAGGGPALGGGSAKGFLRKIAQETGGQSYFPGKVGELIGIFNEIAHELHNHYALAYTPTRSADGTWRAITVKVKRPDADVRVRKGYFAVKRRPRS